jgi:hypothetical protein
VTNITVIAIENKDVAKLLGIMRQAQIANFEIEGFFEVEGFKTLEEVELWWHDK